MVSFLHTADLHLGMKITRFGTVVADKIREARLEALGNIRTTAEKTSPNDPTRWLAQAPPTESAVRIGVAHGSLKVRDYLKLEDHLINRHAARDAGLDYLALGHWHGQQRFRDPDGVERTAYSGVHEPMEFPGATESLTGWFPYSGGNQAEFLNGDKGTTFTVRIDGKGKPPALRPTAV